MPENKTQIFLSNNLSGKKEHILSDSIIDQLKYKESKKAKRIRKNLNKQAKALAIAKNMDHLCLDGSKSYSTNWKSFPLNNWENVWIARKQWARRNRDNLAVCSCWMCGNPRKHWKSLSYSETVKLDNDRKLFEELNLRFKK